jgi:hypothetical protein
MRQRRIAIVTIADDLHALIIRDALRRLSDAACFVVESDRLSERFDLTWELSLKPADSTIRVSDGTLICVRDLDVVWWRRVGYAQKLPEDITVPAHIELINRDCRAALFGVFLNDFRGRWVSHPVLTQAAENKLVQLRAAAAAGLNVPATLVSQNPQDIRAFCEKHDYHVVMKPLSAILSQPIFTSMATKAVVTSSDSLDLCPAIYQACVSGTRHVRAHCFGDAVVAALIESPSLDWRVHLDVNVTPFVPPADTVSALQKLLELLQLRMGIVDFKMTESGELFWLEINPQGQFLFVEGLGGMDLTTSFAEFLLDEASRAAGAAS